MPIWGENPLLKRPKRGIRRPIFRQFCAGEKFGGPAVKNSGGEKAGKDGKSAKLRFCVKKK